MNKSDLKEITEKLLPSFLTAGSKAKKISEDGVKITIKADKSPVTNGDLEVDKILRGEIEKLTPNIAIISEETVNLQNQNKNKTFWLIDPIDGTKDYIKKRDEYTLNAALIINLNLALGIVYAPAKDRLFFSYGHGDAFEIKGGDKKKLNCEKKYKNDTIGLANSDTTPKEILDIYNKYGVTKSLRMSSSLKFCTIAAGEADIYAAKPRAFEWDIAAGHAIVSHAGGIVTSLKYEMINYGKKDYKNTSLLVRRSEDLKI